MNIITLPDKIVRVIASAKGSWKWAEYERIKKRLQDMDLDYPIYEAAIQQLSKRLGI